MKKIMFASTNQGKITELKKLLPNVEIVSLLDMKDYTDVEETETTYRGNAFLKANAFFQKYKIPVLADDSGIEVHSLFGSKYGKDMAVPGVYSARYASNHDEKLNNDELLKQLEGYEINSQARSARYVSTLCYIDETDNPLYFEGYMDGLIALEPKGTNGFAYDTIFRPKMKNGTILMETYAELNDKDKAELSHRSKALKQFVDFLQK